MYAAGNFARRIQARNDFSVGVVHVTARIDFDAAHRVVNRRNAGSRIERRLVDRRRIKRTTERVLRFICNVFVEIVERGFQMIGGNVHRFCKFFDGVRLHRAAGRNEFVRGFVEIVFFVARRIAVRIEYDPHIVIRLMKQRHRHRIAPSAFIDKAVAVFIDKDAAFDIHFDVAGKASRFGIAERQELDVFHLHELRVKRFEHGKSVSRRTRRVRRRNIRTERRPLFVVFFAHFDIACKTAGRKNYALIRAKRHFVARFTDRIDADDFTVFDNKTFTLRVEHHFDALVRIDIAVIGFEKSRADGVYRFMRARPQTAGYRKRAGLEFHAHRFEPLDALPRVVGEHVDQSGITLLVAALIGLLVMQRDRILVRLSRFAAFIDRVQRAAGHNCIASDACRFFDDDNRRAVLICLNAGCHTRSSGSDDDNVRRLFNIGRFRFRRRNGCRVKLFDIDACAFKCGIRRLHNRAARNRTSADNVEVRFLGSDDLRRNLFDCRIADTGRFVVLRYRYRFDFRSGKLYLHRERPSHTRAFAGIGSRFEFASASARNKKQRYCKHHCCRPLKSEFLHFFLHKQI